MVWPDSTSTILSHERMYDRFVRTFPGSANAPAATLASSMASSSWSCRVALQRPPNGASASLRFRRWTGGLLYLATATAFSFRHSPWKRVRILDCVKETVGGVGRVDTPTECTMGAVHILSAA